MVGARMRRRVFDGGELRLVLLKLIADAPRHGYDLIREIEEMTKGAYAPSPGVVYPTLTLLGDMGLIAEQQSEGAKKQYAATDDGRAHLAERAEEVASLMARLAELGEDRARTDSESIRRAMNNLRHVLMHKQHFGDMTTDKLHAIVALIDEAAQKIERLG
ncbi:PadR family transcriptional regulator [Sphingomonas sp.]|uniref:PadR family transcriptional regulator n=1 Tax=Sphingomonas sp. TaxID=28214 RepID=UPI0025F4FFA2|nr:PadR family transcriptional regulator [Sphingomonas sp.]